MDSAPRFTARRLREGYDPAEVDAFIARVQTAIAQSPPAVSTDDLLDARFTVLEHEASYDIDQVHVWLDSMLGYLRTRQPPARLESDGGRRTGAPASGPAGPDADLPPELRDARPTPPRTSESGAPVWARMTALILVVSLVSFFVVSAFL